MPWLVNQEVVDEESVREEARRMRPQYMDSVGSEMDPIEAEMQLKEWARENVIERMLLRQSALADPEPIPEDVVSSGLEAARNEAGGLVGCGTRNSDAEIREQVEMEYRIQRLLARAAESLKPPTEKEIAAYYKKNKELFVTPELWRARHVVKNVTEDVDEDTARAAVEAARAELMNGAPFEEVANRHSDCGGNGGDLGWFPRGEMVEEFENVVFQLPIGEVSEVFRSPFGFHIARVEGRKPSGVRALADVRDEIVEALMGDKRQQALESYLDKLRAEAEIKQVKGAV
jgi:hypothetical protein